MTYHDEYILVLKVQEAREQLKQLTPSLGMAFSVGYLL